MAYLLYRKSTDTVVSVYEEEPQDLNLSENFVLVEYDLDESNDYIGSLRLSEDGTALSNIYAGKSIEEQIASCDAEWNLKNLGEAKKNKIAAIKTVAKGKIEAVGWKVERARERDLLNGNNDAMTEVAAEREAIRQASNDLEELIQSLTSVEEVLNYDIEF